MHQYITMKKKSYWDVQPDRRACQVHQLLLINTLAEVSWLLGNTIYLYEQQKYPVKGNLNYLGPQNLSTERRLKKQALFIQEK